MQAQPAAPQGASRIPNPYFAYGAPAGFAPLTDDAGVYLPTGPGDAQRMELLPFAQIVTRSCGALMLTIGGILVQIVG